MFSKSHKNEVPKNLINDFFKYNSTTLYKNNVPLNLDINKICEDLLKLSDNRDSFDEMMISIDNDVLSSEIKNDQKEKIMITNYSLEQLLKNNSNNNNQNFCSIEQNRNNFRNTIPEGEFISPAPYQQSYRKKYNDVNANCKFYSPSDNIRASREYNNKSQWTNRANGILLNSNSNANNFNTMRMNNISNNQSIQLNENFGRISNNNS